MAGVLDDEREPVCFFFCLLGLVFMHDGRTDLYAEVLSRWPSGSSIPVSYTHLTLPTKA